MSVGECQICSGGHEKGRDEEHRVGVGVLEIRLDLHFDRDQGCLDSAYRSPPPSSGDGVEEFELGLGLCGELGE